jgi:two-component sensor histidine kinase
VSDIVDLNQIDLTLSGQAFFVTVSRLRKANDMTTDNLQFGVGLPLNTIFDNPQRRSVASYERELARLRGALVREGSRLRQKNELIQRREVLKKESDHRLLNSLQMIVSLLSLQSRASENAETASQLAVAANRVAAAGRIHRYLYNFDGVQTVAFKPYLEDVCRELSTMLSSQDCPDRVIVAEAMEIKLPTATAISLGFIVNELIINAGKYGKGRISVRLEPNPAKGYALSVSNDGPALPEEFDPAASKGLGMKIIRSFVRQIGGALRFGRGRNNQGACFTVSFS